MKFHKYLLGIFAMFFIMALGGCGVELRTTTIYDCSEVDSGKVKGFIMECMHQVKDENFDEVMSPGKSVMLEKCTGVAKSTLCKSTPAFYLIIVNPKPT
ncbi:hypothetical protein COT97_04900 [Candidatus Falkowbacteria bacterium CG10_big_fil_rev_8_21_14_0_10_39_11]|uniref:Lipoprotein n=1 Tax=Candidatus Falkowbacteria bacterium CG10_big_fil_rev_8_21_14_0_10_39_11 TaxID=1974565 RepID=A0A2H0V3U7_9BACT|nr:MAG: hypothetical protein COT97_04900 [Candidatus Falkowbacteria bacterium CG10_big_fil_rev_8_21_14_0_10_39_11]